MKRGDAFTPDGPLTLGDLRDIVEYHYGRNLPVASSLDPRVVEVRTPMGPDRRQVTLTVTDETWLPPNSAAPQQDTTTEGDALNG